MFLKVVVYLLICPNYDWKADKNKSIVDKSLNTYFLQQK